MWQDADSKAKHVMNKTPANAIQANPSSSPSRTPSANTAPILRNYEQKTHVLVPTDDGY